MATKFRTFSAYLQLILQTRGDALRSAQRLPLAPIFRAFGASAADSRFTGRKFPRNLLPLNFWQLLKALLQCLPQPINRGRRIAGEYRIGVQQHFTVSRIHHPDL